MGADGWLLTLSNEGDRLALGQVNGKLAAGGLSLSNEELRALVERRDEVLAETGRVEFGKPSIVALAEAFAQSPVLLQGNLVHDLSELLFIFYELRSELPVDVPDAEIIEALRSCFDECADTESIAAMPAEDVMQFSNEYRQDVSAECDADYRITDEEGRVYTFSEAEWEYDEYSSGWEGEGWSDDFDC